MCETEKQAHNPPDISLCGATAVNARRSDLIINISTGSLFASVDKRNRTRSRTAEALCEPRTSGGPTLPEVQASSNNEDQIEHADPRTNAAHGSRLLLCDVVCGMCCKLRYVLVH